MKYFPLWVEVAIFLLFLYAMPYPVKFSCCLEEMNFTLDILQSFVMYLGMIERTNTKLSSL